MTTFMVVCPKELSRRYPETSSLNVEIHRVSAGWIIRHGAWYLTRDDEWLDLPAPSSREEGFWDHSAFESPEAADNHFQKWKTSLIEEERRRGTPVWGGKVIS